VLPQTNLQLYRLLAEQGYSAASLATVGKGYEVARRLFSGSYRPTHKPFVAHLCGTAGALAGWGESVAVICAGLLHSAYLYGNYGDGEKGATVRRRQWLTSILGKEIEQFVYSYTNARREPNLAALAASAAADSKTRDLVAIKLADLLDELDDAGPKYSPDKRLDFGVTLTPATWPPILNLATSVVGAQAAQQLHASLEFAAQFNPPESLQNREKSYQFIQPGVETLRRSPLGRSYAKITRRFSKWRRAA
jgi:hypothetical protein